MTTLCPGGKERMRRLISMVESGRFDPLPIRPVADDHPSLRLEDIVEAYDL